MHNAAARLYPRVPVLSARMTNAHDARSASLLDELDARQNELLDELERLNSRIEQVLQSCTSWRPAEPAAA
jgi:hypothetical protein